MEVRQEGLAKVRVLVVAEVRLYREGVADALRRLPDVESVETAETGSSAVVAARESECDVVLLDMSTPGSTHIVSATVAARPQVSVVALGVREDGPEVIACAEAGISGYVSRDASLDGVADVLRAALRGEVACSGKVAAGLIRYIALQARARDSAGDGAQLTRREHEVLRLLENGLSNKEIARSLDLQVSTVKNHVHNVLGKLGATGRADAVALLERRSSDGVVPGPRVEY